MLTRGNLIMLGFCHNPKLPEFLIKFFHKSVNAWFNRAEIVIFQLLTFRGFRAKQRSAAKYKVAALVINALVNQKILLFRTDSSMYSTDIVFAEKFENPEGLFINNLHGAQQRRLFVQHLTAVRTEGRRYAKNTVFDESIGSRVPRGITPCFKSCS